MAESFQSDSEAESTSDGGRFLFTQSSSQSFVALTSGIPPGPITSTEYQDSEELFTDSMVDEYARTSAGKIDKIIKLLN